MEGKKEQIGRRKKVLGREVGEQEGEDGVGRLLMGEMGERVFEGRTEKMGKKGIGKGSRGAKRGRWSLEVGDEGKEERRNGEEGELVREEKGIGEGSRGASKKGKMEPGECESLEQGGWGRGKGGRRGGREMKGTWV